MKLAPLRHGLRSWDDGASWLAWWLYPRLTQEEVPEVLEELGLYASYGGPGAIYSRRPGIQHSRNYTLLTQAGGWDI